MVCAVEALARLVVGKSLQEIVSDFGGFYRLLTSESQLRWVRISPRVVPEHRCNPTVWLLTWISVHPCVGQLGPEKGVIHLASAAVLNAVWDLWARAEGKVGLGSNRFSPPLHNSECVFFL